MDSERDTLCFLDGPYVGVAVEVDRRSGHNDHNHREHSRVRTHIQFHLQQVLRALLDALLHLQLV